MNDTEGMMTVMMMMMITIMMMMIVDKMMAMVDVCGYSQLRMIITLFYVQNSFYTAVQTSSLQDSLQLLLLTVQSI